MCWCSPRTKPGPRYARLTRFCGPKGGTTAQSKSSSIESGELVSDVKARVLHIPAPDAGNIVGYEYEVEERPFWLQHTWNFQRYDPVRESHFTLQLPPGWEYKASWLSYPEVKP